MKGKMTTKLRKWTLKGKMERITILKRKWRKGEDRQVCKVMIEGEGKDDKRKQED